MKAKKEVKKAVKKEVKKPVAKKADKPKQAASKKATNKAAKKPVKKADKPLARNEKLLFGIRKDGSDVHEVRIYKKVPKGWKVTEGTMTDPIGYKWIDNKKSLFAKDKNGKPVRKMAFIERDWHKKMTVAEKNDLHREHPVVIINKSGKKVTYGKVKKAGKTK